MPSSEANGYAIGPGVILALFVLSLDYLITLIIIDTSPPEKIHRSIHAPIRWLGYNSLLTIFALIYNYFCGHKFLHSILALVLILTSTIGVAVYFIYETFSHNRTVFRDSLNFLLSITYLWLNIIACMSATSHIVAMMNERLKEAQRSIVEAPKLSELLAPSGTSSS